MVENKQDLFGCNEEIEAFMVMACELQKEINNILFLNQKRLSEQSNNFRFNFERKNIFQALMNAKNESQLNSIKLSINKIDDLDDCYLESISNARIILSKIVVDTIDNAEKSIDFIKKLKRSFASPNETIFNRAPFFAKRQSNSDILENNCFKLPPKKKYNFDANNNSADVAYDYPICSKVLRTNDNDKKAESNLKLSPYYFDKSPQSDSSFTNAFNRIKDLNLSNDEEIVEIKKEEFQNVEKERPKSNQFSLGSINVDSNSENMLETNTVNSNENSLSSFQEQHISDSNFLNRIVIEKDRFDETEKEYSVIKHLTLKSYDNIEFNTSYLIKRSSTNNVKNKNKYKANAIRTVYFCRSCSYKTEKIPDLKIHLINHQYYTGSIKCRYCVYYASNAFKVKQHEIKQHPEYTPKNSIRLENEKYYNCKICPYEANNLSNFKKHLSHHKYVEGAIKCRYCPYFLSKINNMLTHEILHSEYIPLDQDKK